MRGNFKKIVRSFINAIRGLKQAYGRDKSFRMEVWASWILVAVGYIFWPISEAEALFMILAFALILIAELLNTALERAWERLHPEHHELVGASKDIASASVFIAVIFAGLVVLIMTLARFGVLK